MGYTRGGRSQSAPGFWHEGRSHNRKLAGLLNLAVEGNMNNTFIITPEEGEILTVVKYSHATSSGVSVLSAANQSAASHMRSHDVFAMNGNGEVVVTHGAASGTERFNLLIFG